jgi:hypothetical protein
VFKRLSLIGGETQAQLSAPPQDVVGGDRPFALN